DIMMPEMDGYETIAAIRKNEAHRALPIVAVTAKALPEDREKCLEVGANDYLPKPVDPDRLLEIIDRYTSEAHASNGAGAHA
ncbi:MAG TPA: response regulator, partial [Polyangiaceae bacterium]